MIDIHVDGNLYIIQAPKLRLALTRNQFIAALKRAKAWRRAQTLAARLAAAQEDPCRISPRSPRR